MNLPDICIWNDTTLLLCIQNWKMTDLWLEHMIEQQTEVRLCMKSSITFGHQFEMATRDLYALKLCTPVLYMKSVSMFCILFKTYISLIAFILIFVAYMSH